MEADVENAPTDEKKAKAEQRRKKIGALARQMATEGGKEWKSLPLDERKALSKQARDQLKATRQARRQKKTSEASS
jgi:hypothetical protein